MRTTKQRKVSNNNTIELKKTRQYKTKHNNVGFADGEVPAFFYYGWKRKA